MMVEEQISAVEAIEDAFNAQTIKDALTEARSDLVARGKTHAPRDIIRRTLEMAFNGISLTQGRAKGSYAKGMEAGAKQKQGEHVKWLTSPKQFLQDWGNAPERHFVSIERFKSRLPSERRRKFERSELVIKLLMHRDFIIRGSSEGYWRNVERDHEILVVSAQGWLSQKEIGALVMRWQQNATPLSREQVRKILNKNWDDIARRWQHLMSG